LMWRHGLRGADTKPGDAGRSLVGDATRDRTGELVGFCLYSQTKSAKQMSCGASPKSNRKLQRYEPHRRAIELWRACYMALWRSLKEAQRVSEFLTCKL
jgi:hypothetical protein